LRVLIRASFDKSKDGMEPRIYEDLVEQQVRVSRKRVVRLIGTWPEAAGPQAVQVHDDERP